MKERVVTFLILPKWKWKFRFFPGGRKCWNTRSHFKKERTLFDNGIFTYNNNLFLTPLTFFYCVFEDSLNKTNQQLCDSCKWVIFGKRHCIAQQTCCVRYILPLYICTYTNASLMILWHFHVTKYKFSWQGKILPNKFCDIFM